MSFSESLSLWLSPLGFLSPPCMINALVASSAGTRFGYDNSANGNIARLAGHLIDGLAHIKVLGEAAAGDVFNRPVRIAEAHAAGAVHVLYGCEALV
jgi:hypothetical protein